MRILTITCTVRPCIVLNWEHISNTIFIQASNVTQFPISPTLFIMNLKYDIKMQYFLCVREIVSAYLNSLALVHFNNVEVKAVDSFPGTKKDGVQREIVSYVDKNLQKRFFRGIRHDSTHNDNEISDQAYSSVNYVCLWCRNLKQRPWKNISEITKGSRNEIWMHSCLQLEFSGIILLLSSENNTVMLISPSHGHADHHSTLIWWCDAPCTIAGQSIIGGFSLVPKTETESEAVFLLHRGIRHAFTCESYVQLAVIIIETVSVE